VRCASYVCGERSLSAPFALPLLFVPAASTAAGDTVNPPVKLGWTLSDKVFFYVLFRAAIFLAAHERTACVLSGFNCRTPGEPNAGNLDQRRCDLLYGSSTNSFLACLSLAPISTASWTALQPFHS
jgi:hypothetical protein